MATKNTPTEHNCRHLATDNPLVANPNRLSALRGSPIDRTFRPVR